MFGLLASISGSVILVISAFNSDRFILQVCSSEMQCASDSKSYNFDVAKSKVEQRYNAIWGSCFLLIGFISQLFSHIKMLPPENISLVLLLLLASSLIIHFTIKNGVIEQNTEKVFAVL